MRPVFESGTIESINRDLNFLPFQWTNQQEIVKMYIDPNTGGMLFQVLATLLAVASGVLLLFSGQIKQLFARLRRKFRKDQGEDPQ